VHNTQIQDLLPEDIKLNIRMHYCPEFLGTVAEVPGAASPMPNGYIANKSSKQHKLYHHQLLVV
jgi:hypothetical protein